MRVVRVGGWRGWFARAASGGAALVLVMALVGAEGRAAAAEAGSCRLALAGALPLIEAAGGSQLQVDARADGAPVRLALDTGSEGLMLTEEAARRADAGISLGSRVGGRGLRGEAAVVGVVGADVTEVIALDDLQLGRSHGAFRAEVTDMNFGTAAWPADGLLGMSVLANFDVDLDVVGGRLRLFRTSGDCRQPAVALDGPVYAMPLEGGFHAPVQPIVQVSVNGQTMRALLDSGTPGILVFGRAAARLGLVAEPGRSGAAGLHVRGIGGTAAYVPVRLDTLVVGPLTLRHVAAGMTDGNLGVDMLLGLSFMKRVHVWISGSSRMLVLQYPPVASPDLGR